MKQGSTLSVMSVYGRLVCAIGRMHPGQCKALPHSGCSVTEVTCCFTEPRTWIGKRSVQSDADTYLTLKVLGDLSGSGDECKVWLCPNTSLDMNLRL